MCAFDFVINFFAEAGVPIDDAVGFGVNGAVPNFGWERVAQCGYGWAFAKSGEAMRLIGLNFTAGFVAQPQNNRVRANPAKW